MKLEHLALWTPQLEALRTYYITYFGGISNEKYTNPSNSFESYFIRFGSGARLELMYRPDIPVNQNDTLQAQHLGLIHFAFEVDTMDEVEAKAREVRAAGFPILKGPRKTGDGYYEFETVDPDNNRIEVTTPYKQR
ncbi:MAG: VOC family protein [Cyclobacteriaceae bacterium]|nr:VOC family protein [Cyclobacteriaceae bacterium]